MVRSEVTEVSSGQKIIKIYEKGFDIPAKFLANPFEIIQDIGAIKEGRPNKVEIFYKGTKILEFYCYRPEYANPEVKREFKESIGELAYTTNANYLKDIHISWTDRGNDVEGYALKLFFDTEAYIIKTIERPDTPGTVRVATWKLIDRFVKEDEDPNNNSYLIGEYLVTVLQGWDEGRPALEIDPDDEVKKAVVRCFEKSNIIVDAYRIRENEWIVDLYNEDHKLVIKKQYFRKVVEESDFSRVYIRKVAVPIGVKYVVLSFSS